MSERLAIKTDHVGDWQKGKLNSAIKDLTPRPADLGLKSCWAHCIENGEVIAIIEDPSRASCDLQALALYFFSERYSRANRNKITGVSIVRAAVPSDLVIEDPNPHPIPAYSETHRSLIMNDEGRRAETANALLSSRSFDDWQYTRAEMAELLEFLLDGGHIDSSMQADARSLLMQWSS